MRKCFDHRIQQECQPLSSPLSSPVACPAGSSRSPDKLQMRYQELHGINDPLHEAPHTSLESTISTCGVSYYAVVWECIQRLLACASDHQLLMFRLPDGFEISAFVSMEQTG